jgi:hypothetical protein
VYEMDDSSKTGCGGARRVWSPDLGYGEYPACRWGKAVSTVLTEEHDEL